MTIDGIEWRYPDNTLMRYEQSWLCIATTKNKITACEQLLGNSNRAKRSQKTVKMFGTKRRFIRHVGFIISLHVIYVTLVLLA